MGAVVGTLTGDLVFMLAAIVGLAAILAARPVLFSSLQWLGIAYLCWVGLRLVRKPVAEEIEHAARAPQQWTCFRQAFAVCLTNPKAVMFFMAFFPLFLTAAPAPHTLVAMVAHVTLLSFVYQAGLVLVGNAVAVKFSRFQNARLLARRLVGLALIGFGIRLAVHRR
jgi:threonine/homoserine/homoserine lactone efflux protein